MDKIGIPTAKGGFVNTKNEALKLIREIGFPLIIRPSFHTWWNRWINSL